MRQTVAQINTGYSFISRLMNRHKFLGAVREAQQFIPEELTTLIRVLILANEAREQVASITQAPLDDAATKARRRALDIINQLPAMMLLVEDTNPKLKQDIDSMLSIINKIASSKITEPYDYSSALTNSLESIASDCRESSKNLFLEQERLAVLRAHPLISALRQYNHF